MSAFRMLEATDLESRIARLRWELRDLTERVAKQVAGLESADRWYRSDPLYQRLSSVLKSVRRDLQDAENEALRRVSTSATPAIIAPAQNARAQSLARVFRRSVARMLRAARRIGSLEQPTGPGAASVP